MLCRCDPLCPVSDLSSKPDWLSQFSGEMAFTPTMAPDCLRGEAPIPNNFFLMMSLQQTEAIFSVSFAVIQLRPCEKDFLKTLLTLQGLFILGKKRVWAPPGKAHCDTLYRGGGAQIYMWCKVIKQFMKICNIHLHWYSQSYLHNWLKRAEKKFKIWQICFIYSI